MNIRLLAILAFTPCLALSAGTVLATNLYVHTYGVDGPGCGAKLTPCRSIGRALQNSVDNDVIFVGPGRYGDINDDGDFEDPGDEPIDATRGCVVCITKEVQVYALGGESIIDAGSTDLPLYVILIDADHVRVGTTDPVTCTRRVCTRGFTVQHGTLGGVRVMPDTTAVVLNHNTARANHSLTAQAAPGFEIDSNSPMSVDFNVASDNDVGFVIRSTGPGGATSVLGNTATENIGAGFTVAGDRTVKFRRNTASRNGVGFRITGFNHLLDDNGAFDNEGSGFLIEGGGRYFLTRNIAASNRVEGIAVITYQVRGGGGIDFWENDVYDNGGLSPTSNPNCGMTNHSGQQIVTRIFWGAASGPGADPADNAGPGCDFGAGSRTVGRAGLESFLFR
jgi:hypothetical protein